MYNNVIFHSVITIFPFCSKCKYLYVQTYNCFQSITCISSLFIYLFYTTNSRTDSVTSIKCVKYCKTVLASRHIKNILSSIRTKKSCKYKVPFLKKILLKLWISWAHLFNWSYWTMIKYKSPWPVRMRKLEWHHDRCKCWKHIDWTWGHLGWVSNTDQTEKLSEVSFYVYRPPIRSKSQHQGFS